MDDNLSDGIQDIGNSTTSTPFRAPLVSVTRQLAKLPGFVQAGTNP